MSVKTSSSSIKKPSKAKAASGSGEPKPAKKVVEFDPKFFTGDL